jgi:hypothetical protein
MHQDQQPSKPFDHPQNITVGLFRLIYAPADFGWAQTHVWHAPGGRITTDRAEAYACAVAGNRLMGGVEVVA